MNELLLSLLFTITGNFLLLLSFLPLKVPGGQGLSDLTLFLPAPLQPTESRSNGASPSVVTSSCCRDTVTNPPALSKPLLPAVVGLPPRHLFSVLPKLRRAALSPEPAGGLSCGITLFTAGLGRVAFLLLFPPQDKCCHLCCLWQHTASPESLPMCPLANTLSIYTGCVLSRAVMSDSFVVPWTVARPTLLSMGFSRQEYWSGLPFPSPGDLPDPGIEPQYPVSPALAGRFFSTAPPGKSYTGY